MRWSCLTCWNSTGRRAEALYAELSEVIDPGHRRQSDAADAAAFIAEIEAI